ncbi:MAG: hypothetical protein J6D29_07535 [Solobacterium sp.]|nr:hypothetical protein [Solobacterium sp.]
MSRTEFDILNTEIQMAMVVKLQQLQREDLSTITYQDLEDYLQYDLWRLHTPRYLHEGVKDILNVTASDIIKFLSRQTIVKSSEASLSEFTDLIGGN